METVPVIFNKLYRFMPMTYTVELLREGISGGNQAYMWKNAFVLLLIFVVFSVATVVVFFLKKMQAVKSNIIESQQNTQIETIQA